MEKYFSQFGKIKQANVMKYTDRQVSRGFGFCIFENPESAELAMETKVHTIDGRKVGVVFCALRIGGRALGVTEGNGSPSTNNEWVRLPFLMCR